MVQATCKRNSMGQSCMQQGGPGVWNAMISRFQKQLNVIRVRSFCNQLAVCTTHYGTVLVSLLIREFSFKFGQRRSIQGQSHYDWGWNAVVLWECIHQPFYIPSIISTMGRHFYLMTTIYRPLRIPGSDRWSSNWNICRTTRLLV